MKTNEAVKTSMSNSLNGQKKNSNKNFRLKFIYYVSHSRLSFLVEVSAAKPFKLMIIHRTHAPESTLCLVSLTTSYHSHKAHCNQHFELLLSSVMHEDQIKLNESFGNSDFDVFIGFHY